MEQEPKNLEINPFQLTFKQFLEKIRDESGLSQEDFLKYRITIPINDFKTFNILKNIQDINIKLEKRTEEELKDETYLKELNKIDPSLILINTELNEFYAKTNITQYYKNYSQNPIELILKFPYNSSVQFSHFTLEMNNKKVVSKVLDKEKAEEKYNDDIARGNIGAISSIKDQNIKVIIGNIGGDELIKLTTEFIQFLNTEDMSFCFTIMKNFPEFCTKTNEIKLFKIQANINIKTHSKITRLIAKGFSKNLEKKFNNDFTQCKLYYSSMNNTKKELNEKEFKILFRTESMNNMNLITQYDPKKDETSCIFNMIYNKDNINIPMLDKPDISDNESYIELYQKDIINSNPSLFIFLIDQSGSMSGTPMELVKESLFFFLQSLPKNSYYQLIGFGSKFRYISSKNPVEYNIKNVSKTISKIKNLKADLGGTYLLKPLKEIFESENYDNINLCRNLFILTDGAVEDCYECLDIISINTDIFRIHTFGIGNYYDKTFIENAGKNGSFNFVNNIHNIKSQVIKALNKALRGYLYNPKIEIENIQKEYEFIPKERVYYQDESFNYYFIIKNKIEDKIKAIFQYYDKLELIKKEYIFDEKNIIKEEEGDIISKIIIGNILNNNDIETNEEIALAKKYQVLSKSTALYAKLENENADKNLSQLEVVEQSELNYIGKNNKEIKEIKRNNKIKCNKESNDSINDSEDGKGSEDSSYSKKSESSSNSEDDSEDSESSNDRYKSRKIKYKSKKMKSSHIKKKKKKMRKKISSDSEDEEASYKNKGKKSKKKRDEEMSNSSDSKDKKRIKEHKKKITDSESSEDEEANYKNKDKKSKKKKYKKISDSSGSEDKKMKEEEKKKIADSESSEIQKRKKKRKKNLKYKTQNTKSLKIKKRKVQIVKKKMKMKWLNVRKKN